MHTYDSTTKQQLPVQPISTQDFQVPILKSSVAGYQYMTTITRQGSAAIVTRFSRPLVRLYKPEKSKARNKTKPTDKPYQRRIDNISRARKLSKLAIAGVLPTQTMSGERNVFITNTLDGAHEDKKEDFIWFRREHAKFFRRLHKLNPNIIIITCYEYQDGERLKDDTKKPRHAIHAHSVVIGLPYLPGNLDTELKKLWPHGNTDIQKIGASWTDRARVIHYMTDYITKDALTAGIKYARLYYFTKNLPKRIKRTFPRYVRQEIYNLKEANWLKLWIGAWIVAYKPTPADSKLGREPLKLQSEMWLAPP